MIRIQIEIHEGDHGADPGVALRQKTQCGPG